jgi:hypothetical protein
MQVAVSAGFMGVFTSFNGTYLVDDALVLRVAGSSPPAVVHIAPSASMHWLFAAVN